MHNFEITDIEQRDNGRKRYRKIAKLCIMLRQGIYMDNVSKARSIKAIG
jgi:hypothetical protein